MAQGRSGRQRLTMYGFVRKLCLVLVAAACTVAGCEGREKWDAFWGIRKKPPAEVKGSEVGSISINELSQRLGLRVAQSSLSSATMTSAGNTVVIVADPGGRVYVNGKPAAHAGPIRAVGGVLCVPSSVISLLRQTLRRADLPKSEPKTADGAKRLQPDQRRLPVVVVDAGHGGKDPGAVRTYGSGRVRVQIQEKDLNLDAALELTRLLRDRGVRVVTTRTDDSTVSLDERVKIADQTSPALMVSIHADAEKKETGNAHGFTVFVGKNASAASLAAAKRIEKRLSGTRVHSRGVRRHEEAIRVLVKPKCPSVLVEMGFMSNPRDLSELMQADHRLLLAKAIAEGVMDFLKEGRK